MEVNALVDTGSWDLVINEEVRQSLGLRVVETREVEAAGGIIETCGISEAVTVHWEDRFVVCNAIILENEKDVLLGAFPLEGLDLTIHPRSATVIGIHGSKPIRPVKYARIWK
jgi:clan AA aspartic protease